MAYKAPYSTLLGCSPRFSAASGGMSPMKAREKSESRTRVTRMRRMSGSCRATPKPSVRRAVIPSAPETAAWRG